MSKIKWSNEELEILNTHYPIYSAKGCLDLLPNRNIDSIRLKAYRMGLSAPAQGKTHVEHELDLLNAEVDAYPIDKYPGNNKTPIRYACVEGHEWLATPNNVLRGYGCPSCNKNGFNKGKPGILYYLRISKEAQTYYKLGITNLTIAKRFAKDKDKTIEVIFERHYLIGSDAYDAEQVLLKEYKAERITVEGFLHSGGNTELFKTDVIPS